MLPTTPPDDAAPPAVPPSSEHLVTEVDALAAMIAAPSRPMEAPAGSASPDPADTPPPAAA